MNKAETKKIWRDLSLPTPDFVEIRNAGTPNLETTPFLSGENDVSPLEASFVVKPAREGSSLGISIVHPEGKISLEDAMKEAIKYDDILIVEAFVEGEEITVPILGEEALTPVTIKPKNLFYDFEAKYLREDTEYLKSDLNPEEFTAIKEFSLNAFSCLGCEGWGRVDLIKDRNNNFQIIEINTVPGLTETSLVPKSASFGGIGFDSLIVRILNTACFKQ
jgi:D-alanine-D-alanine ligase